MGKRKYSGITEEDPKKVKSDQDSHNDKRKIIESDEPNIAENEEKTTISHHGFDVKHFRKELAAKQGQTMVLTQFLQVCLNPDNKVDYLMEYLKIGGNSHEILRQIGQENKKNLTLATPAFNIFHLIIVKVQSSIPHMISVTEEACRYFLNTFMSKVEIMISENSGPRHRKIILKLLTSMVTLNPDLGIEVLNQAPLTPKHLQYILEKPNFKEKDNVRTAFVHFMTSFLVDGHLPLIKALLEKQGLLALVIPGLIQDEAEAVLMFFNILKKNVIDNSFISKSLKLKTFSHQVLHNLFKVFSWKGPPDQQNKLKSESYNEIMLLLSNIILTLFTSHRLGLYFVDNSLGTADANKNQNLYKALLTLKRPWENEFECEVILQIVYKCPDLHRAIISVVEHTFEPQHTPIWEKTINFFIKLLTKLKPEEMVLRMNNLSATQIANFIRFVTLPVPLLKFIQSNLGKDQIISLHCIRVLVKMLQSLQRYMQLLRLDDSEKIEELNNKLEYFAPKHLPTPSVLIPLIQDIINGKKNGELAQEYRLQPINDADALASLIDLLLLYNDIHPAFFETIEGSIDLKKLLNYSTQLTEGNVSVLKFKIVSLWLTLDSTAQSLKNPMFKDLFLIMLEVYTNSDQNTQKEAKETLYKFFRNTSIFEADEDEIHLILYTLHYAKVNPISLIGDIVEYVLANSIELTEYIRNQLVHFEITDANSETSLQKLFEDLSENRNTVESVFLESKVPSPFFVGCMQYVQTNKEVKKKMKHFLCLYVANLLHSNYSPELTEILIGDSKLEVKGYIDAWISEPRSLSETVVENDATLLNIAYAIIDSHNIPLASVFPYLEITEDDSDFTLNGEHYKIDTTNNLSSSELLIWAKYLIFCIVRLTALKQITEERHNMIAGYFECIIATAKKYHMIDICRSIVLSLFKNPHVLNIYMPMDLNKDNNGVIATTFLLEVIAKHETIVSYLDRKYKILKSYQLKNYAEIVKAFVKIKKRKNINSHHTSKVLKVIGLSKEDDTRIFNQIFNADINSCIKDDKEPSFVLELLKVLIDKYSESISLEPQPGVIKKTMKLYTELITNPEMTPNLTNLENTLTQFFENKPQHIVFVNDEIFKKFFDSNSTRKSTSHLAGTLLKLNVKFCNTFKEQIGRPEILSLRELTLPLGNALLTHNQFVVDNKELLETVYKEYKSNIQKLLEKPHKAGQVYIQNWKFVRKLIIECMDLQECEKLFTKAHKFETVELAHVKLIQTTFMKVCALSETIKKDVLINYLMSILNLLGIALKENKDVDTIKDSIANICNAMLVSKNTESFNLENKIVYQRLTESATWQNFCKSVLRDSLKRKTADQGVTCGPQLLYLLTNLVKLVYPDDHDDTSTLFDMITSHSEFLNVMLSHHSLDIKSRLVEFIYTLITKNKSLMKSQQIPVYLSAYHATRNPCDRIILTILHHYEINGLPVNEYKPYVFGDSAANHYAVRKNRTSSLWAHPTANQVLNLFEKDVIERTVLNFPVTKKLDYHYELPSNIDDISLDAINTIFKTMSREGFFKPCQMKDNESRINNFIMKAKYIDAVKILKTADLGNESHKGEDETIYDPAFLFSLLSHLLAPGSVASCFKILRTGLLSVPVMALASHCSKMRAAAYHVLHRFCLLLETETRHKNDKLFLTDFISTLKQSLTTAITQNGEQSVDHLKNARLPAVGALYLAKALMISTAPFDPLYKPVNNFFIAKQQVDLTVVPDFLSLFHDSEVESSERRSWILEVIRYGSKTMTDVNVLFKTMCLKMIMDFSSSVLSDRKTQERIVKVLSSIISIPRACEILIEGYGLISWLHYFVRQLKKEDKIVIKEVLNLVDNMLSSLTVNAFNRNLNSVSKNGKPVEFSDIKMNKEVENEIVFIINEVSHRVDVLEPDNLLPMLRIYASLSRRAIKLLSKNQILNLVDKTSLVHKENEAIKVLSKAIVRNDLLILRSNNLQTEDQLRDLTTIVTMYLSN